MTVSLDHQEGVTFEYGRTAADALRFLVKSDLVLLGVSIGNEQVIFLHVKPDAIRETIGQYKPGEVMPSEWRSEHKGILTIGSWTAIERAGRKA